ncbi:MBL fold metallo-hydrolase [Actinocrinis puniceicyclus]|uniref:MBL fold metallo-hydrolase n=1 Tax=Actinocrinis puniceicyclus TaxID=977794 RepID=A0A8J7WQ70_9ACTN|nr:MBL fold metallo-hydrolase [Actinocrinis puniceicyclus]MBS2964332.1 MBL fold metallo-hydrolase [Actinocrinis puniceicyclus]
MAAQPQNLGSDVHMIDTAMSGYSGITAAYVILGSRPCLVETGTATSAQVVRQALAGLGVGADDLATIVVTHIHLDHAGGVGDLAAAFPRARVVVQDTGARHLADPSRLMASARRVFGPAMDALFGELLPTDAARIDTVGDVGSVDLGDGRRLEGYHTPGHARHHLGLVDTATGDLYVGDAAGLYIPPDDASSLTGLGSSGEMGQMLPGTPPPDFDLDLALESLARFRDLRPTRLLFSHYGPITEVDDALGRAAQEMRLWVSIVRAARTDQGGQFDLDHAVAMVRERTRERYADLLARPEVAAKFEELSSTAASVNGIARWLENEDKRLSEANGQG